MSLLNDANVSGVTIHSGENPVASVISSAWGVFIFGVCPTAAFAALCLYSFRVLRAKSSAKGAPKTLLVRLVLISNIAIMGSLTLLFGSGGGSFGLLLPDTRRPWKLVNYTALAGSSAAVDVLLGMIVGHILRQQPTDTRPSPAGLACFAAMMLLDVSQGICTALFWPSALVYVFILPGMLVAAQLASSTFLAWRCFQLQRQIREHVLKETGATASGSNKILRFNRRIVATGSLSALGAFASIVCIFAYSVFQAYTSAYTYVLIVVLYTSARCCTAFGQILFADPLGLSCGGTKAINSSFARSHAVVAPDSGAHTRTSRMSVTPPARSHAVVAPDSGASSTSRMTVTSSEATAAPSAGQMSSTQSTS
jgi:hypothetical protein